MTTSFTINAVPYTVDLSTLPADITLNTFIREHAQLTATKFMCLEGGCGVCICVIRGKHPASGEMKVWAANSCLTLLNVCQDWEIITSEGIGNKHIGYHPIQKRLAKMNGSQCGFCSPGFVMNMYALMESGENLSMDQIENSFGGNICRCTGYRPILDTMKSFANNSNIKIPTSCLKDIEELQKKNCPKTGQLCAGACSNFQQINNLRYENGVQWHWPKNLEQLFEALDKVAAEEEYMLVAGNTAHGVYRRSPHIKHFIDINALAELKQHELHQDKLCLGAGLSLSETMIILQQAAKQTGFEYCQQLWEHFDLIANVPVRNTGTLAGNISIKKMHKDFPSDVFITFEALDVQVVINENATNQKTISLTEYLQQPMVKTVLTGFELKAYPKTNFVFKSYKIMPRSQNAHAMVNAAFLLDLDVASGLINSARLCFGAINPDFVHATALETLITNKMLFDKEVVSNIFTELSKELQPNDVLPEPSAEYRLNLAVGLFYKFLLSLAPAGTVKEEFKSGGNILKRNLSSGSQTFDTNKKNYPMSEPVEKLEAMLQCSGEATYMNDTLTPNNAAYCAFVGATKVGANIEQIDAAEALQMPGVLAFYSAKDIPGANTFTEPTIGYEIEEIFCSGVVKHYDQPLGMIVATSSDIAHEAADKVKVIYSKGNGVVVTCLEDVFNENDVIELDRLQMMVESTVKEAVDVSVPSLNGKGIFQIGSQYHFTMEPQTTIAVPFEDGLQIWSATQWMDHTQCVIAKMLQMKISNIQLKVRRLGGGYGSKITRCNLVACAAALAAFKLNRPVRFVQRIESMLSINGKRWACRSDYEFNIMANGKITSLTNLFYQDAGYNMNENPIDGHSTVCAKNMYQFTDKNLKLEGQAVLTDAPSAAYCRAPGSVEGIAMIENILEHIAFEAQIDPVDARMVNIIPGHKMLELLPRFVKSTEYKQRRKEIDEFNQKNRWMKRGLGIAIMEYPIYYFGYFPATVSIYHGDGTVVISHGGIEMGQGINTKVAQVAAFVLGIPLDLIKVESSDTINAANSFVTGGAVGSESVCFAVRKACNTLNERLKPIRRSLKRAESWQNIVQAAWGKNINMIVSDCYKQGDMANYVIYGLALTEVEVDILTGSNQVKRVDILEDTGESISPYIDIGQIEGAFVMCLGYWLSEQLIYERQTGQLLTNRTWNYKPPGAKDIPIDFRIEMIQKYATQAGFMRSKATGEPPCCLAVSVVFAIQHALQSARKDAGLKREWVRLGAPTTPETIVLNAGSDISSFSLQ